LNIKPANVFVIVDFTPCRFSNSQQLAIKKTLPPKRVHPPPWEGLGEAFHPPPWEGLGEAFHPPPWEGLGEAFPAPGAGRQYGKKHVTR